MSKIVREDIDNLNSLLSIIVTAEDYGPKFNSELANYRKKMQMKGFRKGKTPMGLVKKMYGKAVLSEAVGESLQNTLSDYIAEQKLELLGQPIPVTELDISTDLKDMKDYEVKFEVGLSPDFELKTPEGQTFDRYEVTFPDEFIDERIKDIRKRLGERNPEEDTILENDMVEFDAEELENDALKTDGWATTFSILVDEKLNDELKADLLTKKAGDKVRFNIWTIENDASPDYIRKQILQVTDDETQEIGDFFEATIKSVSRLQEAELNQEFFDKAFGEGTLSTETEMREFISKDMKRYYDKFVDSLLFRGIKDKLMAEHSFDLPEGFLKKWIKLSNKNVTDDQIDEEFPAFIENLRWSLLKSKMTRKYNVEVSEEEVVEGFKERVRSYFQGFGDELVILNMANRLMEDKTQVDQMYEELLGDKLFLAIKDLIQINPTEISREDFEEMANKLAQQNNPQTVEQDVVEDATIVVDEVEEEVIGEGEV